MSFLRRLLGRPDIDKLEARHDVDGLMKALSSEDDAKIRAAAATALGKLGDECAVEPLMAALEDSHWHVVRSAVLSLGVLGARCALEPLLRLMARHEVVEVRAEAACALGLIGDPQAVEPLIQALGDHRIYVRTTACMALGRLGETRAIDPLIAALEDQSDLVREHAATALGQIGDGRASEALRGVLSDKDEDVRKSVVQALAQLQAEPAPGRAGTPASEAGRDRAVDVAPKSGEGGAAGRCDFCGKEVHEGQGLMTMSGSVEDAFARVQGGAQAMLARKIVCAGCGAVLCLECGNAVRVKRGTGKTHCLGCGRAVQSSQLM